MLTAILLGIVLTLCVFHYFTRCSRMAKYISKIPGPFAWPVVGNLPMLTIPHDKMWPLLHKLQSSYYPIFRIWTTHRVVVCIFHPDDVEILLSSTRHIEKSAMYKLLHVWFGTGLLTSTGVKWRTRRKILTPAFHFNVLRKYVDIVIENSEKVVKLIETQGESIQNITQIITDCTLNIISETAMGTSLTHNSDKELQVKYRKAVHDMGEALIYRLMRPWLQIRWTFRWTSQGRKQKEALKIIHEFSKRIVNERKEYHEKTNGHYLREFARNGSDNGKADFEIVGVRKKRLSMLDLMIAAQRAGAHIDDAGIKEEVDTFIFEGHDTTAMALSFALLLIAEHKDVQERIRSEVNEVLATTNRKIGLSEIQRFSYLELCVKECLRLYPSVPFISRKIREDLQLKNYLIPKGTMLQVNIFSVHRDPNFWPDPEKFDPERFLPERFQGHHPFSYIPFSAGPRNCIGQKFAMMELKSIIAHLVNNFYLEPIDLAHEVNIIPDLVLRPSRPLRIKFVPINK